VGQLIDISAKRLRFADEYVIDGNATAAAIRAGYSARSAHVTACRMLKDLERSLQTESPANPRQCWCSAL